MVAFRAGTQIETDNGFKAIESLERGDNIKTMSGFVPLARLMVSDPAINGQEFIRLPENCINDVPNRDTFVTKYHLMVFDYKLSICLLFFYKYTGFHYIHKFCHPILHHKIGDMHSQNQLL